MKLIIIDKETNDTVLVKDYEDYEIDKINQDYIDLQSKYDKSKYSFYNAGIIPCTKNIKTGIEYAPFVPVIIPQNLAAIRDFIKLILKKSFILRIFFRKTFKKIFDEIGNISFENQYNKSKYAKSSSWFSTCKIRQSSLLMPDNLYEAIKHCEEIISKNKDCKCIDDHKELKFFLTELKMFREKAYKGYIDHEDLDDIERYKVDYLSGVQEIRERVANINFNDL